MLNAASWHSDSEATGVRRGPAEKPGIVRRIAECAGAALAGLLLAATPTGLAAEFRLRVTAPGGAPAPGLVVTLEPAGRAAPGAAPVAVVMDQVDKAFEPELRVIPTGSTVTFPNSDVVSHQVYSFSKAKRFQLPLYRGTPYPPVRFDAPGLVTVGCNIHDSMIGYIVVTDAPWYGQTDAQGEFVTADLPPGNYVVRVRHPRMREARDELSAEVSVAAATRAELALALARPLRPAPLKGTARQWDY
jgi:plastocyanin